MSPQTACPQFDPSQTRRRRHSKPRRYVRHFRRWFMRFGAHAIAIAIAVDAPVPRPGQTALAPRKAGFGRGEFMRRAPFVALARR